MNRKGESSHIGNPDSDTSLSAQAFEYYQQHSQNRKLPQYFCGTYDLGTIDNPQHDQLHGEHTATVNFRPPLIGEDNVTQIPIIHIDSDTATDLVRPPSPTSSVASNRKLEWDNGADIGYDNCQANKSLYKSHSLPILSSLDLQKNYLRLSPEGINAETVPNTKSTVASQTANKLVFVSSSSDNSGSVHNPVYTSSTSSGVAPNPEYESTSSSSHIVQEKQSTDESISEHVVSKDVLNFLKLKVGVPIANSTPYCRFEGRNSDPAIYYPTPISSKPEKPKRLQKCKDGFKLVDYELSPTLKTFQYSIKSKDSSSNTSPSNAPTVAISNDVQTLKKSSSCDNVNSAGNDDTIRKWSSQLDLSLEQHVKYFSRYRNRKIMKLCVSKPISVECIGVRKSRDKDIQTSFLDKVSIGVQTDTNEDEIKSIPVVASKQGIVYLQHLYSDEDFSNATATLPTDVEQVSNCNSFEFLCGSDFDFKLDQNKQSSSSKENSPTILLNEYVSNKLPAKSDLSHESTPLVKSDRTQNLSPDIGQNIRILQKLVNSKKYDEATKKYYINKIVQKIKHFSFDDSSLDSNRIIPEILKSSDNSLFHEAVLSNLQHNVPWMPVSQKTPGFSNTDNKENERQIPKNMLPQHSNSTSTASASNYPKTFVLPQNPIINYSDTTTEKYGTSNDSKSWREDKTLSEQLLDKKQIDFSRGDSPETDHIVKFAQNERQTQLSWINNEIDHLNKLKKVLEYKDTEKRVCLDSKVTKKTTLYMITTEKNEPKTDDVKPVHGSYSNESHLLSKIGARKEIKKHISSPSKFRSNIKRSQSSDNFKQNTDYIRKKPDYKHTIPISVESSEDVGKHEGLNLSDFDNIEKFVSSNDDGTGPSRVQIYRFSENQKTKRNKFIQIKDNSGNWNEQYMKSRKSRNVKYSEQTDFCVNCSKQRNVCSCKDNFKRDPSKISSLENPKERHAKSLYTNTSQNGIEEPLIFLHKASYDTDKFGSHKHRHVSKTNHDRNDNKYEEESKCVYQNLDTERIEADYNSHDHKKSLDSDKPKFFISEPVNNTRLCPLLISCMKNVAAKKNQKVFDSNHPCPCMNTIGNQTKNSHSYGDKTNSGHTERIVVEIHNKRKTPPLINIIEEISSEDSNKYIGNDSPYANSARQPHINKYDTQETKSTNSCKSGRNDPPGNVREEFSKSKPYTTHSGKHRTNRQDEEEIHLEYDDRHHYADVDTGSSKPPTISSSTNTQTNKMPNSDSYADGKKFVFEVPLKYMTSPEASGKIVTTVDSYTDSEKHQGGSARGINDHQVKPKKNIGINYGVDVPQTQNIVIKPSLRSNADYLGHSDKRSHAKITKSATSHHPDNYDPNELQNAQRAPQYNSKSNQGTCDGNDSNKYHFSPAQSMRTQTSNAPDFYMSNSSVPQSRPQETVARDRSATSSRKIKTQSSHAHSVNQSPRNFIEEDNDDEFVGTIERSNEYAAHSSKEPSYGSEVQIHNNNMHSNVNRYLPDDVNSQNNYNFHDTRNLAPQVVDPSLTGMYVEHPQHHQPHEKDRILFTDQSSLASNYQDHTQRVHVPHPERTIPDSAPVPRSERHVPDTHVKDNIQFPDIQSLRSQQSQRAPVPRSERHVPGTHKRNSKDSITQDVAAMVTDEPYISEAARKGKHQQTATTDTPKSTASLSSNVATTTVSSSCSSSSTDSTDSQLLCACCQKRFISCQNSLGSNTYCRRTTAPGFCEPCYVQSQSFHWDQQNPYYNHPQHVCSCYQTPKIRETMTEIKNTVHELAELEAREKFCGCLNKAPKKGMCSGCGSRIKKPKPIAYMLTFEPGEPQGEDKVCSNRSLEEVRIKVPPPRPEKKEKKHKHHRGHKSDKTKSKKQKYTLQECLAMNKPSFIESAEQRRQCLIDLSYMREQRCQKYKQLLALTNGIPMQNPTYTDQNTKKRLFSSKEMKRMTAKKYKTLPEVQQKLVDSREQQIKKANRLLADIFNKKLRENVLKGHASLSASVSVINLY